MITVSDMPLTIKNVLRKSSHVKTVLSTPPPALQINVPSVSIPYVELSDIIPRVIYQTWYSKILSPNMSIAIELLKSANPGFEHRLYDDNDCRTFIKQHFPPHILYAYDSLIPGAYKADLWRYCVLYINGGVYLDIKFQPVNRFSLMSLIGNEQFCYDNAVSQRNGVNSIYNAFMIVKKGNTIMKQCIESIYKNTVLKYYGNTALSPTGPHLLGKYVSKSMCSTYNGMHCIIKGTTKIFETFSAYRSLQTTHYSTQWAMSSIYNNIDIHTYLLKKLPSTIWMTYKTKKLPRQCTECYNTWESKNSTFKMMLYDDNDIQTYLKTEWDEDLLDFYNHFPVGVMKADLWRYCILATEGGVYSDIDSVCVLPINDWFANINIITDDILLIGLENMHDYCQWTLLSTKRHPAMLHVVQYLLNNYKKNGIDVSNPHFVHATTGPSIFRQAINNYLGIDNQNAEYVFENYTNNIDFRTKIQSKGIYLLDASAFRTKFSKNLFGSQHFTDGYIRWVDEVKKISHT